MQRVRPDLEILHRGQRWWGRHVVSPSARPKQQEPGVRDRRRDKGTSVLGVSLKRRHKCPSLLLITAFQIHFRKHKDSPKLHI